MKTETASSAQMTQTHSNLDRRWQSLLDVKSELDCLVLEVDELRAALDVKISRMRLKLKLFSALRQELIDGAEDVVPDELSSSISTIGRAVRKSVAHDVVRRVLSRERDGVDTSDLIKSPDVQLIGADPKTIYNVLNYLAARGDVERVSRGRYRLKNLGCAVETMIDVDQLEDSVND